jgi:ketosteroid isomerase-like protein
VRAGDAVTEESLAVVSRFDAAFAAKDVDAVMAAMTEDCVFDATAPPEGRRYVGQEQVRAAWVELFAGGGRFEAEERFGCGDRVVVRWRYLWDGGHVRGVDLFRVRDGLVAEKLAYVKG